MTRTFVRRPHLPTVHVAAVTRPGRTICGQKVEGTVEVPAAEVRELWRECQPCATKAAVDTELHEAAATVAAAGGEILPYSLALSEPGTWIVRDRQTDALLGTVRRVEESMRPGMVQWTRWVAYRPDGSRVQHTDSLPGAARLLVPLSEQAQETLSNADLWR